VYNKAAVLAGNAMANTHPGYRNNKGRQAADISQKQWRDCL